MCYTSGTTGNPKGVVYSHRSTYLHSLAVTSGAAYALNERDRVLLIVPMFHANAWGLPYAAWQVGADLVLPGRFLQAAPLARLIASEKPTIAGAVPTIWNDILRYGEETTLDLVVAAPGGVRRLGGAAHADGALPGALRRPHHPGLGHDRDQPARRRSRCRRSALYRRGRDDVARQDRPRQRRRRAAHRRRRRPAAAVGRHDRRRDRGARPVDHRRPTTAIPRRTSSTTAGSAPATSAPSTRKGFIQITDRAKDVIKSGGEWISSVELENEIMAHPDVVEAAVIGVPDERWEERPLACVVLRPGTATTPADAARRSSPTRVARWWLPERLGFIAEVPKTSVGKFDKKVLRARHAEGGLEVIGVDRAAS